eukprot:483707-Pleurochrysis_carterae.AAC.1
MSSRYDLGVVCTALRSCARYFAAAAPTLSCTKAMWCATFSRSSALSISTPLKNRCATEMSASCGHA